MKKASIIIVSIILLSCNGNNSVRNQENVDVDSAVIDTMDVQPLKDESHKKLAKNNPEDPIVGTYYCYRTQDTYVFLSDKTGYFTVQGGSPSDFIWKRSGKTRGSAGSTPNNPEEPCNRSQLPGPYSRYNYNTW